MTKHRQTRHTSSYAARSVAVFFLFLVLQDSGVTGDRDSRRVSPPASRFQSKCGTADEVSARVGVCMRPIFDLIEGKYGVPKNDQDLQKNCNLFFDTEKCVRTVSKDCLTGLHKTAVGAFATATRRFRTQECRTPESRARYAAPLKCSVKKARDISLMYKNHTGMAQYIRDLSLAPEEKLMKSCCLLNQLDKDLAVIFDGECPESTAIVLQIVHAMTDDARNTLCVRPRCAGVVEKIAPNSHYKPPQNFIEPIMQVLLMLSTE